jgi:hypothetical protein
MGNASIFTHLLTAPIYCDFDRFSTSATA